MSTTLSGKALVRRHSKAFNVARETEKQANRLRSSVAEPTVYVPEFDTMMYWPEQIDSRAAEYEKKVGWPEGSDALNAFRCRIAAYRRILCDIQDLHSQWRKSVGLESLEARERDTGHEEHQAWQALIDRLKTGRDTGPINRYLAGDKVPEAWKLRQAFQALCAKPRGRK